MYGCVHAIVRGLYVCVPAHTKAKKLIASPARFVSRAPAPVLSTTTETVTNVASSPFACQPFRTQRNGSVRLRTDRGALTVSGHALHTRSSTEAASDASTAETSLLAQWLLRRKHEPTPAWVAHVQAQRARVPVTASDVVAPHTSPTSAPDGPLPRDETREDGTPARQRPSLSAADHTPIATPPTHSSRSSSRGGAMGTREAEWSAARSLMHTTTDTTTPPAHRGYVPLLYREGVLPPGSQVRLPELPPWLQRGVVHQVTASSHEEAQAEEERGDVDTEAVPPLSSLTSSSSPSDSAVSVKLVRPPSRTLILDPVKWLAQDIDAPLMETEMLKMHITPSAYVGVGALYESWRLPQNDAMDTADRHSLTQLSAHLTRAVMDGTAAPTSAQVANTEEAVTITAAQAERDAKEEVYKTSDVSVDTLMHATSRAINDAADLVDCAVATTGAPTTTATGHSAPTNGTVTAVQMESAADPPTRAGSPLVYNVFTGRVAQSTSASIGTLTLMGVGVHAETRQLTVRDPGAVVLLAQELRSGRVSWPKSWSRGVLFRQVKALLSDDTVDDPATQLALLLQQQYARVQRRQQERGGVVTIAGGDAIDSMSTMADSLPQTSAASGSVPTPSTSIGGASRASELLTLADLNEEQQQVVEFVKQGYHTYIGGGAGTGKSVLLRVLRQELLKEGLTVAMTGTTGMAGWHIGGCTLHHCFGINILGEFTRRKELAAYDVVVIDEVSMLSRHLFESFEYQLRRANGVDLPFGGVQVILCGDFLQLGAIAAQPIVNSPVFRANFAMLKLKTTIRQDQHQLFSRQLEVLRRGKIPEGLQNTVQFLTAEEVVLAKEEERKRSAAQLQQLRQVLEHTHEPADGAASTTSTTTTPAQIDGSQRLLQQVVEKELQLRHATEIEKQLTEGAGGGVEAPTPTPTRTVQAPAPYVADAVNLLPTNAEVEVRNQLELMKLKGDAVSFPALIMPPTTLGTWTPTCLLRIQDPGVAASDRAVEVLERRLLIAVEQFLASFFISKPVRPWRSHDDGGEADGERDGAPDADAVRLQRAATSWLSTLMTGARNIVLYRLFTDAFVLRVRIPAEVSEMDARAFLTHFQRIDESLLAAQPALGVRVREWLESAEGLHTEQDEYTLGQYAARSPMSHGVQLKIGARVMLRTNLGPRHVNGSLGTVIGFRALTLDDLPRYLVQNPQREEAVQAYIDFLQLEHGMAQAVVPEVDFGDGHAVAVPPVAFYVGGHANTHQYSAGIVALPLTLAYAFTVHKVQGLTLVGRVHLELSRMWPCEHLLYVAMSRVRNPEQLSVSSFSPRLVQASPECVVFDDSIPDVHGVKVLPAFVQATWRRSPSRRKRVVKRKQLEAAQRRKQQQQQRQLGEQGGGEMNRTAPSTGPKKQRSRKADMDREIERIRSQLLAAEHNGGNA